MSCRTFSYMHVGMLLFFLLAAAPALRAGESSRPNILWIFCEDLSPFLGCYNDPVNTGHTPTIDRLASNGVLFQRAYATAPVCSASRSAIITGVMQTTTGTHQHRSSRTTDGQVVPESLRIHLPEGMKTIPELMCEAGYFTFNSGKDDYNFHYDRRSLYSVGTNPNYVVGMNGWQGNKARFSTSFTKDTWNSRKEKSRPWFGQIMLWGGKANARHVRAGEKLAEDEVPVPPYFPDIPAHRKSWTMHYNAVRGTDAQVEQILAQLEADGEREKTIVFFFSDHGSNQSLRHKQFCYEGGLHIPLIIAGKHSRLGAGVVSSDLVSALDISATTLALAGIEVPSYFDGRNLFADKIEPRSHVISARDRCDFTIDRIRTVRTDSFRYLRNYFLDRPMLQAQYRDPRPEVTELKRAYQQGKLTPYQRQHWFGTRPKEELYDLAADPHQIDNLAEDPAFAEELQRHRQILDSWISATDDQGQYAESSTQLRATYELWKDRPVFKEADTNPEYDQFRTQGE